MRHRNAHRKLSRNSSHRRAMLRNLVTDFLDHGRLMTTLPKAKEVRPLAEKMITLGKRDNLHARRQLYAYLLREAVAKKVFETIAPRFSDRKGGYSRIIKLGNRKGDGADLAIIELLGSELEVKKAEKAEKAKEKAEKAGKEKKEEKEEE
ncbi:MAG: 50S ribosomal protein L17 [Acidobacteria bacterium]|nr:MAG: 50S ribosomal protein L17 [Acidobacteria bacterium 13_1_40CM_2_56_5]PYS30701.1 MAG: 50S ribosomal protein L17 [Acidobacteriota bacterium]